MCPSDVDGALLLRNWGPRSHTDGGQQRTQGGLLLAFGAETVCLTDDRTTCGAVQCMRLSVALAVAGWLVDCIGQVWYDGIMADEQTGLPIGDSVQCFGPNATDGHSGYCTVQVTISESMPGPVYIMYVRSFLHEQARTHSRSQAWHIGMAAVVCSSNGGNVCRSAVRVHPLCASPCRCQSWIVQVRGARLLPKLLFVLNVPQLRPDARR